MKKKQTLKEWLEAPISDKQVAAFYSQEQSRAERDDFFKRMHRYDRND